jgi:hypothetical protein
VRAGGAINGGLSVINLDSQLGLICVGGLRVGIGDFLFVVCDKDEDNRKMCNCFSTKSLLAWFGFVVYFS